MAITSVLDPSTGNVIFRYKFQLTSPRPAAPAPQVIESYTDGWQRVVEVLEENYEKPDLEAARAIYAAGATHVFKKFAPVWLLAIAPPGSMKTDLLESLRGLPGVHFIDEVTPNAFLSGKLDEQSKKRAVPASLLHRIGKDGILVAADFSTYTADPKRLQIILSQLRRIYDGNYCREFGTDENLGEREWHGRLTLFAGAVPDIDRHYELFQKLGERFSRVRWDRAAGVEVGLRAMHHTDRLARELREAVYGLLSPILSSPPEQIVVPKVGREMELRIASLGELVALARSHVERDRYTREVVGIPITEGNTRLPQQLCQITKGSSLLDGRTSVNERDFQLACRVAFDSLPAARRAVLEALIRGQNPYSSDLASAVAHRTMEDFQLVGVAEGRELSGKAIKLLEQAQVAENTLSRKWNR